MNLSKGKNMRKDLQNGRSMIEMLGVLSIIGILTVGGFNLISKTVSENRVNKVIDEVSDLARRTRVIFREFIYDKNPADNADMSEYIFKAKSYPDVLEWDSSKKVFIDDDDVEMSVSFKKKEKVEYYILKIANMSDEICMAIANGQWGTRATNGFSGISMNNNKDPIGKSVTLDDAAGNNGCNNDNSTIYIAFR